MKSSVKIWIVSLLLGLYGVYCLWVFIEAGGWFNAIWGVIAVSGCVGLITGRRWSQYIVYFMSLSLVVIWTYLVWLATNAGWPDGGTLSTVISLFPGVAIVVTCAACSFFVFKHFQR